MNYLKTLLLFQVLLFFISCKESKTVEKPENELLDNYTAKIDSLIAETQPRLFNGVILITKKGDTKYLKEVGYSNFEEKTPISINDKFRIMSNSKQVTAALILKEAENEKIDLHKSVKFYLPEIKQTWADTVTVHHLLNMSSGIVDIEKPLIFEAGKGYRYSNPAYGLLGRILEKICGKPYTQSVSELFKELGMNHSYCYDLNKTNEGLINGYWLKEEEVELVDFDKIGNTDETWKEFVPAGGIVSTAHDLNIWDTKLHLGEILDSHYYKQMVVPSNEGPHAAFDNDTIGYAYGLRVHDRHETMHLGHGGRGFGFSSIKFYVPEKELDVIIWENVYSKDDSWMAGDLVYYYENEIRKIVLNSNLVK